MEKMGQKHCLSSKVSVSVILSRKHVNLKT